MCVWENCFVLPDTSYDGKSDLADNDETAIKKCAVCPLLQINYFTTSVISYFSFTIIYDVCRMYREYLS